MKDCCLTIYFKIHDPAALHDTETQKSTPDDPIYQTPPLGQDMTQGQFLSGVQQV